MDKQSTCMSPALKIHRLAALLEKQADHALQADLDITFSQFMILHSLEHNPDCSQRCIANCRDLTQAAVSRQIDALRVKKFLVRRENELNRREHILKMTQKGWDTLAKGLKLVEKTFDDIFGVLPKKDLQGLEQNIDVVIDALRIKKKEECDC